MEIRLLQREEIEKARWNGCVHYANNSRIYGYTWYLDNVCENWMGLVEGDYESVFPLVWNNNVMGYKQIFQPYLTQQLGIFSVNVCSQKRIQAFIDAIPKDIRLIDTNLNDYNTVKELEGFQVTEKPNYILSLMKPYEELSAAYDSNLRRNLKKANKLNLYSYSDLKPEPFVEMVKQYHQNKGNKIPDKVYHTALRIIYNCLHRGQGFILGTYNDQKELLAAVFWMVNGNRFINLLNVTTEQGRSSAAMHYLLDTFIRSNAEKPMFIDFEGSSIEGIAQFYKAFGAENVPYYNIRKNMLPFWLKWLKK